MKRERGDSSSSGKWVWIVIVLAVVVIGVYGASTLNNEIGLSPKGTGGQSNGEGEGSNPWDGATEGECVWTDECPEDDTLKLEHTIVVWNYYYNPSYDPDLGLIVADPDIVCFQTDEVEAKKEEMKERLQEQCMEFPCATYGSAEWPQCVGECGPFWQPGQCNVVFYVDATFIGYGGGTEEGYESVGGECSFRITARTRRAGTFGCIESGN
jgi:hypothetical protein